MSGLALRTALGSRGAICLRGMRKTKAPEKVEKKKKDLPAPKKAYVPENVNVNVRDQLLKAIVPPIPREVKKLTPKDLDERAKMTKAWARYRLNQERANIQRLCEIAAARDEALASLKEVSEDLYNKACIIDTTPWPITAKPMTTTPPIPGYKPSI